MKRILGVFASLVVGACGAGAVPAVSAPVVSFAPVASASPARDPSPIPTETSASASTPSASPADASQWHVVAVGDSIPFNSPDDCPGCTGFVDGYAHLLAAETGHPTVAQNLSEHNGLQASGLSYELDHDKLRRSAIAGADVVIVSIGHNDTPWNTSVDACDGPWVWDDPFVSNIPYAAKYTKACARASADSYRPTLASIYHRIVALREGRPTVFLALNTYNDFLGWCELRGCSGGPATTPPEVVNASRLALDAWNRTVCETAKAEGLQCVDVYHLFGGPDATSPAGDLLAGDYTHPSQAGNDKIAQLLLDMAPAAPMP